MKTSRSKYGVIHGSCHPYRCPPSITSFLPDDARETRTGQRVDAGIPRRTYYRPIAPVEEAMDGMEVDDGDYLQETFIPINHSQQPLQRTVDAIHREGKWDARRAESTRNYIASQVDLGEIAKRALNACHASIADTLRRYGSSLQCCDGPMEQDRLVPVLFIDEQFCIRIQVPVHRCNSCGTRVAPQPVKLGCHPATPSADISLKQGSHVILLCGLHSLYLVSMTPCPLHHEGARHHMHL